MFVGPEDPIGATISVLQKSLDRTNLNAPAVTSKGLGGLNVTGIYVILRGLSFRDTEGSECLRGLNFRDTLRGLSFRGSEFS